MPALYSNSVSVADIKSKSISGIEQLSTITATGAGTASLNGRNSAGGDCVYALNVVAGDFVNHDSFKTDLLASHLGRSGDARKIYVLQRMLFNNLDSSNAFYQMNPANKSRYPGKLACGSVCWDVGEMLFGSGNVVGNYNAGYHVPVLNKKPSDTLTRDEIKYTEATMNRVREITKKHLEKGVAVRVGVVDSPSPAMLSKAGILQATLSGGHTVLIVGCNAAADEFLYVDPWWGGSKLQYKGGIGKDPYPEKCEFLGIFEVVTTSRGPVMKTKKSSEGTFTGDTVLEVVSGPWT